MRDRGYHQPPVRTHSFFERGGWWVLAQGFLLAAILVLSLLWHTENGYLPVYVAGALLFILGGIIGVAGARTLGRNLTPFPRPNADTPLVRHGIYAYIRHPLYTSVILMSVGWALVWHSLPALFTSLLLIPFFISKAHREEHFLRNRFPEYETYMQQTHRFLPWF